MGSISIRQLAAERSGKLICAVDLLSAEPGERVAIVGPNGCGKTTLLRILAGLDNEFTGTVVRGVPLRDCVLVHQSPYLFRGSVLSNVTYGLAARGMPYRQRTSIARRWLGELGIGQLAEKPCSTLSGGELRRVALARALAIQPALLLLDEPLAELDAAGIGLVAAAVTARTDSTIVIATPVALPGALREHFRCVTMKPPCDVSLDPVHSTAPK